VAKHHRQAVRQPLLSARSIRSRHWLHATSIVGIRRTIPLTLRLSARAHSSTAAPRPQNLTSGRRSSRLAPKSLILEVVGLGRAEPIFIAASCSQDIMRSVRRDRARVSFPLQMAGYSVTSRVASRRFQHRPLRHFPVRHVAPERDQQLACERDNRDPPYPPTFSANPCAEPTA
jgi:hypothetical protein